MYRKPLVYTRKENPYVDPHLNELISHKHTNHKYLYRFAKSFYLHSQM